MIWQVVCREWYHAVNDNVARIQVKKVPADDSSAYRKLAGDLAKYPTFAPRITSVTDETIDCLWNSSPFGEEEEKTSFGQILSKCISLRRLCLSSVSLDWLYFYLKQENSSEDNSTRSFSSLLKRENFLSEQVTLNQETVKTFKSEGSDDLFYTYEYTCKQLLQVCYMFKEPISNLYLVLEADTPAHTYLNTKDEGLFGYISEFTNLETLVIDCPRPGPYSNGHLPIEIDLASLVADAEENSTRRSKKLEKIVVNNGWEDLDVYCDLESAFITTNLKELHLHIHHVTMGILKYIMDYLPRLKSLNLAGQIQMLNEEEKDFIQEFQEYCCSGRLIFASVNVWNNWEDGIGIRFAYPPP